MSKSESKELNNINLDVKTNININDIKSNYIIKKIFSLLKEKPKLKLVKCSKYFQKILSLTIENYKQISVKYLIYETNTYVKEYLKKYDQLLIEGEYLNGKRNGKGKEYHGNKIIQYEGEYKNDKRNGLGKEYYYDGILEFEGEYLDGKKWNGKEFDNRCKLICELKNGNGTIIEYDVLNNICLKVSIRMA